MSSNEKSGIEKRIEEAKAHIKPAMELGAFTIRAVRESDILKEMALVDKAYVDELEKAGFSREEAVKIVSSRDPLPGPPH